MKYSLFNKYIAVAVTTMVSMAACNDKWDEHYDGGLASTSGSLYNALSGNPNYSHFTKVVTQCGYDKVLGGSQSLTLFAPSDACLSEREADSLIAVYQDDVKNGVKTADNRVVKQFLKNHIANYKQQVSALTHDTITMLNGKYQVLTPTAIGVAPFVKGEGAGTLCTNGLFYGVEALISYFPNVYEYMGQDSELDSVYNFLTSFNQYEFQPDKSVPGDIVDGQVVYLDSVVSVYNSILSDLGHIDCEDSTYTMLVPTNSEWNKYVSEYESYFNFDDKVQKRDSLQYTLSRIAVIIGAVFNNNENPETAIADSAVSTQAYSYQIRKTYGYDPYFIYYKPFEVGGVFAGAQEIACSNGRVLKTSDYRINKFDTFMQTIKVEAESNSYLDSLVNAEEPFTVIDVAENNPFYNKISGHGYVDIIPKTPDVNPIVTYNIPDVASNIGYDIYAVFAPVLAQDTLALPDTRLPNFFRAFIGYNDQQGTPISKRAGQFITTPDVVDTVLIASDYKFPTASYGLSDSHVNLQFRSLVQNSQTTKYSRTLHLDCLLLVPHDKKKVQP